MLSLLVSTANSAELPSGLPITGSQWSTLQAGDPVVLTDPGSKTGKERLALAAIVVPQSPEAVWGVINDKESATEWVEGLRSAKVTESGSNYSLIYQEMKIGFLPGSFKYVVRHNVTTPNRRVDFHRESGSFKSLEGYWQLYPLESDSKTLVLYQLKIDPGVLLPASVVRDSLEKSLPDALVGLRGQVAKVEAAKLAHQN